MNKKLKAISLFSSAGIGELLLNNCDIDVVLANELIKQRVECYQHFYPSVHCICGDIREESIKSKIISINDDVKVLIATPPCQGLSTLGKNKVQHHYEIDSRNYLVLEVLDIIDRCDFDYIFIENVPKFIEMYFPYKNDFLLLEDILIDKYSAVYNIEIAVLNAKDYGISQSRPRAIIKMFKKGLKWSWPLKEAEIPLKDVIGHLPTLESGEESNIPWHFAKVHNERAVLALKHTAPGKSAIANEVYYPKKENGERIKGFHNTFKRMTWEHPAHARTTFCGSISSHNNVHPGRQLEDGTYSDARVLTLLETFIVSSIPENTTFPTNSSDSFIRTIIGESIPPLLMMKILGQKGKGE
jgi:DNA (cytosine-5)-methyltransferase 1